MIGIITYDTSYTSPLVAETMRIDNEPAIQVAENVTLLRQGTRSSSVTVLVLLADRK